VGSGLVLVFESFQKNILKGMGETLINLPLSVIATFSDVVSYLRLFAVGYASVVVSQSFNEMAIGDGVNSVIRGLITALILFFGHLLNAVLSIMAVLVHGVRLNMLEFSSHMKMAWSGKEYKPFTE
jgi:V/A-type H+-transporting ATPase subunit I